MDFWLSTDLSTRNGTLAIAKRDAGGRFSLLSEVTVSTGNEHSEKWVVALDGEIKRLHLQPKQLVGLVTTAGPGSFTGLRIAFSTLKAMAYATGATLWTVDGGEVRALTASEEVSRPVVITQVASSRWLRQSFVRLPGGELQAEPHQFLDSDPGKSDSTEGLLPLTASLVFSVFAKCQSKRSFQGYAALAEATPRYFGTSFTSDGE